MKCRLTALDEAEQANLMAALFTVYCSKTVTPPPVDNIPWWALHFLWHILCHFVQLSSNTVKPFWSQTVNTCHLQFFSLNAESSSQPSLRNSGAPLSCTMPR